MLKIMLKTPKSNLFDFQVTQSEHLKQVPEIMTVNWPDIFTHSQVKESVRVKQSSAESEVAFIDKR